MKKTRHISKVVTILFAAVFIFACTSTVFGATDLVGGGTGNPVSNSTSTSTRTSTNSSTTYNGTGSTSTVSNGAVSGVTTTTNTKGAVATPTTTRVASQPATGVFEKILPFLLVICAAVMVFWVFFHFQMNQVRYGKSEKYYKEMLDFHVMCRN